MPRFIRITHYKGKRAEGHHVYLDTHEVELITVPVAPIQAHTIRMKSGMELSVSFEDFERIEKAMRERENQP